MKDLTTVIKDTVDSNESLLNQVFSVNEGEATYDALVYKFLRAGLSITSRLDNLYEANNQKVKRGQLLVANNILAGLFRCHIETDNLDGYE